MKLRLAARTAALLALSVAASPAAGAPFTGSLTVYVFGTQQALPAVVFGDGNGTSSTALVTLPGDVFVGTATATTPISSPPSITGNQLVLTGHDPGSFTGGPLAGAMALRGRLSLTALGGAEIMRVPLSVAGAPGAVGTWESGPIALTAIGAPWSAGNVVVTVPTSLGGVRTTSFAGYDNRVGGVGTLQLVTPIRVHSTLTGDLVFWSALTLTFVPEPASAVLLGFGTLALAFLGQRRRHSSG